MPYTKINSEWNKNIIHRKVTWGIVKKCTTSEHSVTGKVAFQKAQSGKGSLKEEYLSRDPNEVKEQSFSSSHNQNVCFKGRAQITTTNICTFLLFYVGVFL